MIFQYFLLDYLFSMLSRKYTILFVKTQYNLFKYKKGAPEMAIIGLLRFTNVTIENFWKNKGLRIHFLVGNDLLLSVDLTENYLLF